MDIRTSRREFLCSGAGLLTSAAAPLPAFQAGGPSRTLLTGGAVLCLDPAVGNFQTADVLIEGLEDDCRQRT